MPVLPCPSIAEHAHALVAAQHIREIVPCYLTVRLWETTAGAAGLKASYIAWETCVSHYLAYSWNYLSMKWYSHSHSRAQGVMLRPQRKLAEQSSDFCTEDREWKHHDVTRPATRARRPKQLLKGKNIIILLMQCHTEARREKENRFDITQKLSCAQKFQ